MNTMLNLSSSPHARDHWSTRFIMHIVALSLLPATVMGVLNYGLRALWVVLAAVVSSIGFEFLFDRVCHKPDTWKDGSALVTGLMMALAMSPNTPLYLPVIGAAFAIIVVKCCFGGLGKNFVNPALAGRCFLMISFGRAMSDFSAVDAVSSATPVATLLSGQAVNVTRMFIGSVNGVIGSSIAALLAGGLLLWALDIIHGQICFSVLGGFTLFVALFGGQGFDPAYLAAQVCGGGVVMGAFFMATDYVTSPVSRLGQTVYGLLIGVLGGIFRLYGSTADSFSYSVIIGNLCTPLIDTYIISKPFAYRRAALQPQTDARQPFYRRIPKPVVVLTVITVVAGLALSGVFTLTKDAIEEQNRAARAASYREVCEQAEKFAPDEALDQAVADLGGGVYGTDFGRTYINEAVPGLNAEGEIVGYVVSVTTADGFEGDITLSVGLDPEGTLYGIAFTELNETPGMGMRCADPEFMDQFVGRTSTRFTHNKSAEPGGEDSIDAISGASTSSGAVVNAVNAALDFFHTTVKGEG